LVVHGDLDAVARAQRAKLADRSAQFHDRVQVRWPDTIALEQDGERVAFLDHQVEDAIFLCAFRRQRYIGKWRDIKLADIPANKLLETGFHRLGRIRRYAEKKDCQQEGAGRTHDIMLMSATPRTATPV